MLKTIFKMKVLIGVLCHEFIRISVPGKILFRLGAAGVATLSLCFVSMDARNFLGLTNFFNYFIEAQNVRPDFVSGAIEGRRVDPASDDSIISIQRNTTTVSQITFYSHGSARGQPLTMEDLHSVSGGGKDCVIQHSRPLLRVETVNAVATEVSIRAPECFIEHHRTFPGAERVDKHLKYLDPPRASGEALDCIIRHYRVMPRDIPASALQNIPECVITHFDLLPEGNGISSEGLNNVTSNVQRSTDGSIVQRCELPSVRKRRDSTLKLRDLSGCNSDFSTESLGELEKNVMEESEAKISDCSENKDLENTKGKKLIKVKIPKARAGHGSNIVPELLDQDLRDEIAFGGEIISSNLHEVAKKN